MPATFSERTWKVTPGGLAIPIFSGRMKVDSVYWENPLNIGDLVVLQNSFGQELFTLRCEIANISQQRRFNRWWDGFQIGTFSSGTLYIDIL